jgi:hypothetical protein
MKRGMSSGRLLLKLLVAILFFTRVADAQKEIPADFCISQDELKLYNSINDYRKSQNLAAIPLSKSLCYVAQMHISDLITNKPDSAGCNFHSWSAQGQWKPCCYKKENKDKYCILSKPKEITNYPGIAHEIVYWESREASVEKALKQWKEVSVSRFIITNYREWEKCTWNAAGVAIEGGFAILWLGEDPDVEKETKVCGGETIVTITQPVAPRQEPEQGLVVTSQSGRFYLIFGNMNSLKEAKLTADKYRKDGFSKVKIIATDNKYRISLADYPTKELAVQGKKELPSKFKDAWVMSF